MTRVRTDQRRRPLVVDVGPLRRGVCLSQEVSGARAIPGLTLQSTHVVDDTIELDLELSRIVEGVEARGTVRFRWDGECRRCLESVIEHDEVEVLEVFEENAAEGETYPIVDEMIDLEPMLRDAVVLALPLAPLCRTECPGPAPSSFPTGPASPTDPGDDAAASDPRWAALDELRFD